MPCRQSLDGRELEASLKGRGLFFQLNGSEQRLCITSLAGSFACGGECSAH